MAGRPMGKLHQEDVRRWRFYVYEVLDSAGRLLYIGKGSGRRMATSLRQRGGEVAREVAFFKRERDAYAFEVAQIAERSPSLNVAKGGNGSKASKPAPRRTPKAFNSRPYAARLWLAAYEACAKAGMAFAGDSSKLEAIRRVAYG